MAEVHVLRPGYAYAAPDGTLRAGGTVTLVIAGDVRILVDTGGPAERSLVLDRLAQDGVSPEDVDHVVCTHGHTDHVGNNNLFPEATFLVGQDRSVGDAFTTLDLASGPVSIAAGVQIVATPGHTSEDISVLVHTESGVVAIVGDLFEHADDIENETWIQFSRDPVQQRRNRAEILSHADFIVPGHGPMFSVAKFRARP